MKTSLAPIALVLVLAVGAGQSPAQQPTAKPTQPSDWQPYPKPTPAPDRQPNRDHQLLAQIAALEKRLADLEDQLRAANAQIAAQQVQLTQCQQMLKKVQQTKADAQLVAKNAEQLLQLQKQVGALMTEVSELQGLPQRVRDNEQKLGQILIPDGQGGWMIDLLGAMVKKRDFRKEFSRQVIGRLRIVNPGPFDQIVWVNGARWRAPVGRSSLPVPHGPLAVTHVSNATPHLLNGWKWDEKKAEWYVEYRLPRTHVEPPAQWHAEYLVPFRAF